MQQTIRDWNHKEVIRELRIAQLLPHPLQAGLLPEEYRKIRNRLKAARRARRG